MEMPLFKPYHFNSIRINVFLIRFFCIYLYIHIHIIITLGHSRVMIWNVFLLLLFASEIVRVPFLFWFVVVFATRIMQKCTTGIYTKQGTDWAWNTEAPPDFGELLKKILGF